MKTQNRKAMFAKYREQKNVEHVRTAIRHLEYTHGHKPLIGAIPLTIFEKVELNNLLLKEGEQYGVTKRLSNRTIDLLERLPPDDISAFLEIAQQNDALKKEVVRNGRIELEDVNLQKKVDEYKKTPEYRNELMRDKRDRRTASNSYNRKYNQWGMKKS